jgi:hypothetical protein
MTNTERRAVASAQAAYQVREDNPCYETREEYKALVDQAAMVLGVSLDEAYELVENGPVVFGDAVDYGFQF